MNYIKKKDEDGLDHYIGDDDIWFDENILMDYIDINKEKLDRICKEKEALLKPYIRTIFEGKIEIKLFNETSLTGVCFYIGTELAEYFQRRALEIIDNYRKTKRKFLVDLKSEKGFIYALSKALGEISEELNGTKTLAITAINIATDTNNELTNVKENMGKLGDIAHNAKAIADVAHEKAHEKTIDELAECQNLQRDMEDNLRKFITIEYLREKYNENYYKGLKCNENDEIIAQHTSYFRRSVFNKWCKKGCHWKGRNIPPAPYGNRTKFMKLKEAEEQHKWHKLFFFKKNENKKGWWEFNRDDYKMLL